MLHSIHTNPNVLKKYRKSMVENIVPNIYLEQQQQQKIRSYGEKRNFRKLDEDNETETVKENQLNKKEKNMVEMKEI